MPSTRSGLTRALSSPRNSPPNAKRQKVKANEKDGYMYVIAPQGDLILVLSNANAPFAVFQGMAQEAAELLEDQDGQEAGNEPGDASLVAASQSPEPGDGPIRLRLSAAHMKMASKYFEAMLDGPWREAYEAKNGGISGTFEVNASDWDIEALVILMNVIHGHLKAVPRKLSLEQLAKIAVLVDYYQCHEVMDLIVETWLRDHELLPKTSDRETIMRVSIACIFSQRKQVWEFFLYAVWFGRGPIDTGSLPISESLINWVDETRRRALDLLVGRLFEIKNDLTEKMAQPFAGCHFECIAAQLGILCGMMQISCVDIPQVNSGYLGISLGDLEANIRAMRDVDLTDHQRQQQYHVCSVRSRLVFAVEKLRDRIYSATWSDAKAFGTHV